MPIPRLENGDVRTDLGFPARTHKKERKYLIKSLQDVGAAHNVRITILSGDV